MSGQRNLSREPIRIDRVRRIDRDGFAFLPNRFLREGFFESLSRDELALYVLLVMVGDRRGMSYYRDETLGSILKVAPHRLSEIRHALLDRDIVAFDGFRYQVLSLPGCSNLAPAQGPSTDGDQQVQAMPAARACSTSTATPTCRPEVSMPDPSQTPEAPAGMPEQARHALRRLWGQWGLPEEP